MEHGKSRISLYVFFTILVLWTLVIIAILVAKLKEGVPGRISNSATVQDVNLCDVTYSENGSPISVTICGYVATDDPAWLSIYLFKLPKRQYISENQPEDFFNRGYFARELNVDGAGNYLVEIYLFRNLIGSTQFEINTH